MDARTFVRVTPPLFTFLVAFWVQAVLGPPVDAQSAPSITIPNAWNDRDLSDWATPLAGLGLRPGFYSQTEFERIPVPSLYRTYPMYHPDREPAGYWEWLQKQTPTLLLDATTLHSERDWIKAGRIVFRELYRPGQRGPQGFADLIPLVRSRAALERAGIEPLPDGTLPLMWVVTPQGVLPVPKACSSCHTRYLPDGKTIDGAAGNHKPFPIPRLRGIRGA